MRDMKWGSQGMDEKTREGAGLEQKAPVECFNVKC